MNPIPHTLPPPSSTLTPFRLLLATSLSSSLNQALTSCPSTWKYKAKHITIQLQLQTLYQSSNHESHIIKLNLLAKSKKYQWWPQKRNDNIKSDKIQVSSAAADPCAKKRLYNSQKKIMGNCRGNNLKRLLFILFKIHAAIEI